MIKISFISGWPTETKHAFSGTPYYMAQALERYAPETQVITAPKTVRSIIESGGEDYIRTELQAIGRYLSDELRDSNSDLVICLGNALVPYLETDKPIILWHDSIWFAVHELDFEKFKREHPLYHELDQLTFEKSSLVIFAAEWVKQLSIEHYSAAPEKIRVVPFGANIEGKAEDEVYRSINQRPNARCELTFIAKNWRMKGLQPAFEVARNLNKSGLPTTLNVIGNAPPKLTLRRRISHTIHYHRFDEQEKFKDEFYRADFVKYHGFLHKDEPQDNQLISKILLSSHFLLHPTSFDCFGLVLAEANALGIPSITTNILGPDSIIRDGVNGYKYPLNGFVESATSRVLGFFEDYPQYINLAMSSYREYEERLNWETSVKKVLKLAGQGIR